MPTPKKNDGFITDPAEIAAMSFSISADPILGVEYIPYRNMEDGRGGLTELWSVGWKNPALVQPRHVYQSATDVGVVKAWHLHKEHTDQFAITRGKIQIVAVDLRRRSPTLGRARSFILGERQPGMLIIPPGILHGWKALSAPEALVVNLQTHVYDPADEYRVPYDAVLTEIWEPIFR